MIFVIVHKHVHLLLHRLYPKPEQYFDVHQLAPNLCHFETSRLDIMFSGNLVEFEDGIMKILWWLFNI